MSPRPAGESKSVCLLGLQYTDTPEQDEVKTFSSVTPSMKHQTSLLMLHRKAATSQTSAKIE